MNASRWLLALVALALVAVLALAATWVYADSWDQCVAGGEANRVSSCSGSEDSESGRPNDSHPPGSLRPPP